MKIKIGVLFLMFLMACSSPDNTKLDEGAILDSEESLLPSTKRILSKIIGNDGGIIRGIDIGDPISKIQGQEVLEQFENEDNRLGYTFDTQDMQTVDIQYLYNSKEFLKEIQIDVYMNSEEENQDLLRGLTGYFNNRFGASKVSVESRTWQTDKVTVAIKVVQTKLDSGLHISFLEN